MRNLMIGLASLAAVAAVTPASAQGVYLNAPGVSVGVGVPVVRERVYVHPRHRSHRHRHYRNSRAHAPRCTTTTVRRDNGSVKTVRRCR